MSDELTRAETWLTATLLASAPLTALVGQRVYSHFAEPGCAFPYVVFVYLGGRDVRGHASNRIMHSGLWLVKATINKPSFADVKPVADAIDVALHAAAGSVAGGGTVLSSVREQPFSLVDMEDGVQYRSLGGQFRILTQV